MLLTGFVSELSAELAEPGTAGREIEITRGHLREALADDAFVVDSMARQLELLKIPLRERTQRGIRFARCPRFNVRPIYWPPHFSNTPHVHDTWTVGGVLLNEVEVSIYETLDDRQPVRSHRGREGEVGILDPPTVHQISNRTNDIAVTLHVFGRNLDTGGPPPRVETRQEQESERHYREGLRKRMELSIVQILARRPSPRSLKMLETLTKIGGDAARAAASATMTEMRLRSSGAAAPPNQA